MEETDMHELCEEEWQPVPVERVDGADSRTLSLGRAKLWALVLEARFLPSRVEPHGNEWRLLVPSRHLEDACRELRLFVEENRQWPPLPPPVRPGLHNALATFSVLILVATFHNVTHLPLSFRGQPIDWVEAGSARAGLIMHGEWWRLATALTLHGDWLHLLSNLAIGALFMVQLCSDLGSGLSWSLLLASGMLGNLANAYVQLPSHNSIGSSTVVFATVGVLGAINMVRYRNNRRKRWALPVAGAVSLLVLLGTEGKQTDLGAHLFGFLFGVVLGWGTAWLVASFGRPPKVVDALLALIAAAVMAVSWWAALVAAL